MKRFLCPTGKRGSIAIIVLLAFWFAFVGYSGIASADVTIDNGAMGTSSTGTWAASGAANPYGANSLWARDGATYTWQFNSQPAGMYEVHMWWTEWPSRTSAAQVRINHGSGSDTTTVNQRVNGGQWNSLGTFYFDTSGSVAITAANGSTVSTCADAVWFQFVSANTPPSAFIDQITPNPAEPGQEVELTGHGTDSEGTIAAYEWSSNIDGILGSSNTISYSSLTEGTHIISFRVQDEDEVWSEPATATLVVGAIPTEIIIDNLDPETTRTGTWAVSGATGYWGTNSVWSRDGTTFTYNFNAPQTGNYEVFLWWTEYATRSTAVPVSITHADGTSEVSLNQRVNGGQWNSLGVYRFTAGTAGRITITAANGSTVSTCADAVRFNYTDTNDAPVAIIDSISPNPAEYEQMVSFNGHGSDSDGTIEAYSWESDISGQLSTEPSFSIDTLPEAVHTITFRVQDNEGLWSLAATETLTVGDPPNSAPTAVIDSINPNPANIGQSVSFEGHGEDSDGSIDAYRWESDIDGLLSEEASFSRTSLSLGTHTISFRVFDDDGASSDPVTRVLTVEDVPVVVEMDNSGAGTSYTGTWAPSGATDFYGTTSLWARDGATYTWSFSPTVTSHYEVFEWHSTWPSRTQAAQMTIQHVGGVQPLTVNQQINGGQWNSLGIYEFQTGTTYRVTITAAYGSTVSTCADGMKFVKTSQPPPSEPVADFSSDKTTGGIPTTINFYDQSSGNPTEWLWDFGDGNTSDQENPSHTYTTGGAFTVSLTVTNSQGSDTVTKDLYVQIYAAVENIYLVDGYSYNSLFLPRCYEYLEGIGARQNNGVWSYEDNAKGVTYYIYSISSAPAMEAVLKEEGAHIIFNGHSNYGLGAAFATSQEIQKQEILNIYYVDDDRLTNYSTDMVSLKVDGMKYGQAYPNWNPIFRSGESAIMPYDFSEGLPPYNYYLTYKVPGDPETYRIELANGSYVQRFPDSNTPAWFSPDGSPPDPVANPEYFITNSDPSWSRAEFIGNWPINKIPGAGFMGDAGYLGYNYQYHLPGSGANKAIFTLLVRFPGYYLVMGSWYPSPENATNAKFTINHAYGSDVVEVDQRTTMLMNPLGNPGVYYFEEGAYTVELSDEADGTVIADAIIFKSVDDPAVILTAEFGADSLSGSAPHTVAFKDHSAVFIDNDFEAEISAWSWDFGDGNTSNEQNPTHTYSEPGVYTVRLTVTDSTGAEALEEKMGLIVVGSAAPVHAEFTAAVRMNSEKTIVNFKDQSSGDITTWQWDFGDGSTSSEQNPMHVYDFPGSYTVRLTVNGPGGNDAEVEEAFVTNTVGTIYVDNTFDEKPHFYSGSLIKFGKVIVNTGDIKIPQEELRYKRLFYGGCNSTSYYPGVLNKGIMFFAKQDVEEIAGPEYLRRYLLGDSDDEILASLNAIENAYEYYNFNLKPPSRR